MGEHFISQCKHGVLMGQCRCIGPKVIKIVPCGERCIPHAINSKNTQPVKNDYVPKHAKPDVTVVPPAAGADAIPTARPNQTHQETS